jgi:hypothetical protein
MIQDHDLKAEEKTNALYEDFLPFSDCPSYLLP